MSAQTNAKQGKAKTYFKGVKAETKKVIWPSKKELVKIGRASCRERV